MCLSNKEQQMQRIGIKMYLNCSTIITYTPPELVQS
nr:MAG TPA_asm: hypothetical protein [Caudoviricetes sp.]